MVGVGVKVGYLEKNWSRGLWGLGGAAVRDGGGVGKAVVEEVWKFWVVRVGVVGVWSVESVSWGGGERGA